MRLRDLLLQLMISFVTFRCTCFVSGIGLVLDSVYLLYVAGCLCYSLFAIFVFVICYSLFAIRICYMLPVASAIRLYRILEFQHVAFLLCG